MTPRQVEAFRAIILTGGITAAGELLFVTQPAISRLIHDLEEELGFKLFDRRKNRIYPTSMAMTLYSEVERSFVGMDRIANVAKQIRDFETGKLRINCMPALATSLLPKLVVKFAAKHPKVSVDIDVFTSQTILQRTETKQCDVGFILAEQESYGVMPGLKLRSQSSCIMPHGHPLSSLNVITPKDMENYPFVSIGHDTLLRSKIDNIFEEAGVSRKLQIESSLSSTTCNLVKQGVGLSIVDQLVAESFGVEARPFLPNINFDYSVIQPMQQTNSGLVNNFLETLTSNIPNGIEII